MQLAAFLILIVTLLGASSGEKRKDGNLAVKKSTPIAHWKQGKVPYEISREFGTNITKFSP